MNQFGRVFQITFVLAACLLFFPIYAMNKTVLKTRFSFKSFAMSFFLNQQQNWHYSVLGKATSDINSNIVIPDIDSNVVSEIKESLHKTQPGMLSLSGENNSLTYPKQFNVGFSDELKKLLHVEHKEFDLYALQNLIEKEKCNPVALDNYGKTAFYYMRNYFSHNTRYLIFSDLVLNILKQHKENKELINDVLWSLRDIGDILKLYKSVGFDKAAIDKKCLIELFNKYTSNKPQGIQDMQAFIELGIDENNKILDYFCMHKEGACIFINYFDFFKQLFKDKKANSQFLERAALHAPKLLAYILQHGIICEQNEDVQKIFELILKNYKHHSNSRLLLATELIKLGALPTKLDNNGKTPFYYLSTCYFIPSKSSKKYKHKSKIHDFFIPYISESLVRRDLLLSSLEKIEFNNASCIRMFKALDRVMKFCKKDIYDEGKIAAQKALVVLFYDANNLTLIKKLIEFGADPCSPHGIPSEKGMTIFSLTGTKSTSQNHLFDWEYIHFFKNYRYNSQAVSDLLCHLKEKYKKVALQHLCRMYGIEYKEHILASSLTQGLLDIKLLLYIFKVLKKQNNVVLVKPIQEIIFNYILMNSVNNFKK